MQNHVSVIKAIHPKLPQTEALPSLILWKWSRKKFPNKLSQLKCDISPQSPPSVKPCSLQEMSLLLWVGVCQSVSSLTCSHLCLLSSFPSAGQSEWQQPDNPRLRPSAEAAAGFLIQLIIISAPLCSAAQRGRRGSAVFCVGFRRDTRPWVKHQRLSCWLWFDAL